WIDLLRPTEWGQANEVGAGRTIYLDLPEMGAVGDAQVMGIGPCPPIDQGPGTVITGTFKRESDGSHVVELRLEGQEEPTGVTDNHPYWSVDRQKFVEVGNLRVGELVDTEFGSRHIESVRPCFYREFLYNLETSEHVFRVGSLGALVHNSCVLTRYADDGGHHIFAKRAFEGLPGYNADDALAIGQQELARLGLPHLDPGGITASQRRLFGELAASGRANTLAEHARIALEALLENGMKSRDAADVVRRAESQLRSWGITTPLRIPWN
ncbi:MAG TPA: hypothetical protein VFW87_01280, partial [Pirellulales bacterium]|nr:hypothetical protein [Pirellulales bacterium]